MAEFKPCVRFLWPCNLHKSGNPLISDCLTTEFHNAGLQLVQWQVDNDFYPPQPLSYGGVAGAEQGYHEALLCMDRVEVSRLNFVTSQNNGSSVTKNYERFVPNILDFTNKRCLVSIDFEHFG